MRKFFKNSAGISTPLIVAIVAVLLGAGAIYAYSIKNKDTRDDQPMETMEEEGDTMTGDEGAMMDEAEVQTFNIDASNFKFSESEMRVKKSEKVVINLYVAEGFHDWVVDEFDARTAQAGSGETVSVEFVADESGTFEYYCSVGNHRAMGMVGKLIVE